MAEKLHNGMTCRFEEHHEDINLTQKVIEETLTVLSVPFQVCSNCRPKLTCCPTCRGPLGSIRNLAMEKVANSVLFPCKYASSGCEVTLPHTDKTEHEELCEFRPYSCPCPGASCKWQGSLDAVMPHLMHQHKSITTLQVRRRPRITNMPKFLKTRLLECS